MSRGLLALALAAAACATPRVRSDTGPEASAAPDAARPAPVLVTGTQPDPDDPVLPSSPRSAELSCLGHATFTPPASATLGVTLVDVATGDPGADLCAHVYPGPIGPGDTCAAGDPRADASGQLTVTIPLDARFALRLFPHAGATALDSYPDTTFFDASAGALRVAPLVSIASINELALASGVPRDPARAAVTVIAVDCRGLALYGAELRLVRADGTAVVPGVDAGPITYGDGSRRFTPSQPWTHVDGLAGIANVEVREPGETVWLEVLGRLHAQDEPMLVGCEAVQLVPGGAALVSALGPLRADAPVCPEAP